MRSVTVFMCLLKVKREGESLEGTKGRTGVVEVCYPLEQTVNTLTRISVLKQTVRPAV